MENQRVNRHRSLNFPAELKVEIVDCLPAENAVHFLANVPSRLIIRHCAPRVRQMLVHLIAADYARKLPPKYRIFSLYGHNYTPQMDIFLRYGAVHSNNFLIWGSQGCRGFFGFPANFFDDLIKHCYQTKVPTKAVNVDFGLTKPAPWPTALIQPQAEEMEVEELEVDNRWGCVRYIMRNKHNPSIAFKLHISFNENNCYYRMQNRPICYQQMTSFIMFRVENVSSLLHLIAADYARKMPPPVNGSRFFREKAYKYTPQMDIFLRYGAAHSDAFLIWGRLCFGGFVGFPANFFDDLIKHYYETKVPTKAVHNVEIDLNSPVPWPVALIEPQAGEMGVEEVKADNGWKWVHYIMRNKHNPGIAFKLIISFDGEKCYRMPGQKGPKCYQQMIGFAMRLVENAQLGFIPVIYITLNKSVRQSLRMNFVDPVTTHFHSNRVQTNSMVVVTKMLTKTGGHINRSSGNNHSKEMGTIKPMA